jgi:hypothetical protein
MAEAMGEECSASGIDDLFWQLWPQNKLVYYPSSKSSIYLADLPRTGTAARPEALRKVEACFLNKQHGLVLFHEMPALPDTLKLTDTLYGQSAIVPTKEFNSYVRVQESSLEFLGKDLGGCHIHVAHKDTPSVATQAA